MRWRVAAAAVLAVCLLGTAPVAAAAATVERVSGDGRVATAVELSRRAYPDGADAVVIVGAAGFADALSAAPLASTLQAPLLLTEARLPPAVRDEIARLGAERAVIVGAVGAVPYVVQLQLEREGLDVTRVAGEARFDTAALVSSRVAGGGEGTGADEVVLAGGRSFPDALAVAPLAAAEGTPILLAERDDPTPDTATALAALGVERTLVVGGRGTLSDAVLASVPEGRRISGPDRYETSVEIAQEGLERNRRSDGEHGLRLDTVYVATGRNFPDALAAGPLAARTRSPLLLVDGADAAAGDAVYAFLAAHRDGIDRIVALGGRAAISDAVLDRLRAEVAP